MSVLQGGKFGNGFASAGIAKGFTVGGAALGVGDVGNFVLTTLAGRTASVATGGKFASGAQSAALAFLVNDLATKGAGLAKDSLKATSQNSGKVYPAGAQKINVVYRFAKITNPDLSFGDDFSISDLGEGTAGRVMSYPWGNSEIKIDDQYLKPLPEPQMSDLLDTFIHEAMHKTDSFIVNSRVDVKVNEVSRHDVINSDAKERTKLLKESFNGHIKSVYR